ncbi:MAG TPA: hypothetical protein DCZ10_16245 [Pelotomaculum sp.]|jgi:hypothetical protein|nr:hypothetical protein [Pelotomaculum sp.]
MRFLEYLKRFTYTPNDFYDHLMGMEDAASGDVDLVILPAMTGDAGNEAALEPTVTEANADLVVPVTIQVMNKTKTKVLAFYNGTLEVKVDITSAAGTIAIDDGDAGEAGADAAANMTFENGVCNFNLVLGGTWAENDTIKVTVDDSNVGIMGYTVEKNAHFLVDVDADPAPEG